MSASVVRFAVWAIAATFMLVPLGARAEAPPPAEAPPAAIEEAVPQPDGEVVDEEAAPPSTPSALGSEQAGADLGETEQAPAGTVSPSAAPVAAPTVPSGGSARRVQTRTATISIRSFTPAPTLEQAVARISELGGYVQSSDVGRVEMRVPMPSIDAAIEALREVGEVVDEQVSGEDVTLEIVTAEARIQELESSRLRVTKMLAFSANVADSLAIEKDLQEVTNQLEAQQGRLRYLNTRASWAPLTVLVSMKARPRVERPNKRRPFAWVGQYGLDHLLD